ncbi:transmembrane protein [Rhynchospora pubera]|uniref:Transmembrane protein n=1 Tax=Rhynchospora pubera TaxID=906938 RepID=A0AAV8FYP1_9POAL|nr:transmembrane protein [Rhynchospora pubera]KAJ4796650.1 transmembrane protein [Rhynchospora pubera]
MGRTSATEKLAAVVLGLLAVLSPLYIDRKPVIEVDEDEGSGILALWLPLLLIFLIVAINFSCFMEKGYMRFDPYWIHRVGGSSCGLIICLLVLGFVLKFKASL